MQLFLEILGYSFIVAVLGVIAYAFVRILTKALSALSNNDD